MMMYIALAFLTLSAGCQCAQWSRTPKDGARLYVCEGQDLKIPWKITPDTGEQIRDIKWFYGLHSNQAIAEYTAGTFLPTPSYSQRVRYLANGGIVLSQVTLSDAGTYTVHINISDANAGHVTQRHTAVLHVASVSTARVDATLDVRQQPNAVYNEHTGQYHVTLSCSSRGVRPPTAFWMTPSRQTLPSSERDPDTFHLLLPNPVCGGNYTCRVPPNSAPATCLPRNDPALTGATVFVDAVQARMTLLEARLTAVQAENSEQKTQITSMEMQITGLETQITALNVDNGTLEARPRAVQAENSEQKTQNTGLQTQITGLRADNGKLEARLTAVQAENSEQKTQITGLETQIAGLETQITGLRADNGKLEAIQRALQTENTKQKTHITGPKTHNNTLNQEVQTFKDIRSKGVIFHAQLQIQLSPEARIKPDRVYVNEGNAYNATTGEFTVPYSGYYYFTATTAGGANSTSSPNTVKSGLMVDGSVVSYIYTMSVNYYEQGTCSYAGHLNKDQKVWLQAWVAGNYRSGQTTFSGFLLY